jgi:ABC-type amino acid transport system permease subunit
MSLSASLLAAFGAVLAKQWLGDFKTSRFGKGALHERCQRRQQKFNGLEAWHFSTVISTLPILLQLSLFFFGISLAANIWTQQHTVASVIMATTAFGSIFYFSTIVASLKSADCPFQTQ